MDFRPHKVSVEVYKKRSLAVTKEQMNRLQASPEFDRWERRQSRRFWFTLKPSFVEVLVMIATVGLMAGVCHVANVVEKPDVSPRHSHLELGNTKTAASQAVVTVEVHPIFGPGEKQSQALGTAPPLLQQTSKPALALLSQDFTENSGGSSTRDVLEGHGSNALVMNASAFPCNSSTILNGTPVVVSVDMNQAVLNESLVPEAAPEPVLERLEFLPEVQLDRALAFAAQSQPKLQLANCTWYRTPMQGHSASTPMSLDIATGALAVISLLILLVSCRKVLRTGSSGLAQLLTISASWVMHQVLFALGWAAGKLKPKPKHKSTVGAVTVAQHVGFMDIVAEHVGFKDTQKSPLNPTPRLMGPVMHLRLGLRVNKSAVIPHSRVALGPIIYAEAIAADNQDGPPALVLKRTPSHDLLHLAGLVSFELRLPDGITFQAGALSGGGQASIMAVLPAMLGLHQTAHAMYNWPQTCLASSVDRLNSFRMMSPVRATANCLSTYHSRITPDTSATKPVTASCGTQATLACLCDLAHQLEGKCREVQQLQNAKDDMRIHAQYQDATVRTMKLELQSAANKHLRLDRHNARCQKALEHDINEWQQHYTKEHHSLQALRAQHHDLRKNCTLQAANTKRAEERAALLATRLQYTEKDLSSAERVARYKCEGEVASKYTELRTLREQLKKDRQALSVAEAAMAADKYSMEQRDATARHQVQRTMANQANFRRQLNERSHQVALAGAASMVMMTHAQELQQQCDEQLSEVRQRHADLDDVQKCQEYETKALGIKEGELEELSGKLYDVRVDLDVRQAAFAAKEKLCLQELATKRLELDAEAESKGRDLTAREAAIKAHEEQVHKAQQQVERQQQQLASHHRQLQQAEAALTASMAAHQAAPSLGDLQAAHQDLLQRNQALDVWQEQLAHHADTLELQKQSLDQQRMTSSTGMNSSVADQLQQQRIDLEQRYLPAIQALEQQRDFLQEAADKEADKAAEVLHQKEQEWLRHLASAQQDAHQQLQQTQQEMQQKQQEWQNALATAQQNAQQALQQKQQEVDASRATAHHHVQQTVDDAVKRSADALQDAVAAAQQELQQKQQEWKAAFAIAQQSADQALQQKQQEVDASHASAHHAQQTVDDAVKRSAHALQNAVAAAQQEAQQAKQEAQQAAHQQQQLTASLQAAQQQAEKAESQAKQAEQQRAAWQAQASSKAARLHEVEQRLQQVLQSQQQQPAEPCATRYDATNMAGGGSSPSVDQDLADQMAALFSKQQPVPATSAAAASSAPAADNLPPAAPTGALGPDDMLGSLRGVQDSQKSKVTPDAKSSAHCWMTLDDLIVDPPGDAQSTRQDVQPRQITGRMCAANYIVRQSKKSSRLSAKLKNSGLIQKQLRKSTGRWVPPCIDSYSAQ